MSTVSLKLQKTDSDFLEVCASKIYDVNGNDFYHLPFWFEKVGDGLFVQYGFDDLPKALIDRINENRGCKEQVNESKPKGGQFIAPESLSQHPMCKKEVPIKVHFVGRNHYERKSYEFITDKIIPESKYQSIKEAIEGVLNGVQGQKVEISDHEYFNRGYSTGWKDAHKYNNKKYTEEQLLQARRDAFDAAREVVGYSDAFKNSPVTVGRKYKDNEDYINSLNK